ncbi:MAG: histidine phosphatase family protein [SAR324 cluster bacterium]|nr:histidine phosphatase family protein [SAR324 cluster bacterium]
MKTLYVLRHAKSSWEDPYREDHDRPLASRGLNDAPMMGKVLDSFEIPPTLAITSTAKRARQTVEMLAKTFNERSLNPLEVKTDRRIYSAPVKILFKILSELPEKNDAVLLAGHNPQLEELISLLCFDAPDGGIRMPTAALAQITFEINQWKKLETGTGILSALIFPRLVKRLIRQKKQKN